MMTASTRFRDRGDGVRGELGNVADAMHAGVISRPAETTVRELAATMAEEGIHCVVVSGLGRSGEEWGIASGLDVLRAVDAGGVDDPAREIAATELVTVSAAESLAHAARMMVQHEVTHLVVLDAEGEPAGVLSSLDLANAIARAS